MSARDAASGARHRRGPAPGGSAARLALRQVGADPWVSALVALVILLVSLLATAWPRVVDDMNSRQVAHVVDPLSVVQRDLIAVSATSGLHLTPGPPQSVEEVWGEQMEALVDIRRSQPEPLRSMLRPGFFHVESQSRIPADPGADSGYAGLEVTLRVDPYLAEHVRLVEGRWPSPCIPWNSGVVGALGDVVDGGECAGTQTSEVVISRDAAEKLHWDLDERRGDLVLAGTYEPLDPDAGYWRHAPNGAELGELFDGNVGTTALLAAYLAAANPGTTGNPAAVSELRLVLPVTAGGIRGDEVAVAATQLRGLASAPVTILPGGEERPGLEVSFDSQVIPVLQRLADEQRVTGAVLAVLAAGPLGVVAAVLALAARLAITRRRAALALALARGGSARQLRWLLGVEGAAVGLPAAALGYAAAGLLRSDPTGWAELVVTGVIGLSPAVAMAATAGTVSPVHRRSDLGSRSQSRLRWVAETAVVALAGVAVWRLWDRGLAGAQAAPEGVDPLLAATPVLIAVAAALLTLRVYPLPVTALSRMLKARRGLTGFLGAARAVRDPAGGLLPALAVILGVSVAVFSTVISSTVTRGAQTAAWEETGAQIRVSGARTTDELVEQLRAVDGVAAVARVADSTRPTNLTGAVSATSVRVIVVDEALREVQAATPLLDPAPEAFAGGGEGPVRLLTGGALPEATGTAQLSGIGTVEVVGHVEQLPGHSTGDAFVLIGSDGWQRLGRTVPLGNLALVGVTEDDRREEVAAQVREAVPNALVQTPQEQLETYRSAPVTAGLADMSLAAVALATVLTVLAIVLVQLIGAPARGRLLAVLRTLGLGPRQGRGLATWELAPLLTAAFVVGGAVGVLVPWLVVRTVDLRAMTGGNRQPELALDPVLLGAVTAALLLVIAAATVVAAAAATRSDITRHLRIGEE